MFADEFYPIKVVFMSDKLTIFESYGKCYVSMKTLNMKEAAFFLRMPEQEFIFTLRKSSVFF
jgi:hypothetical protein